MPKIKELTHGERIHIVELASQGFSNCNVPCRLGVHTKQSQNYCERKINLESYQVCRKWASAHNRYEDR